MSIRQKILLLCILILTGNGIVGYTAYKRNLKLLESELLLQHTEKIISVNNNLRYFVKNTENCANEFILTNDSNLIEVIRKAGNTCKEGIKTLYNLTADNKAQQRRIDSLNFYLQNHLLFSLRMIELRTKKEISPDLLLSEVIAGKFYSKKIERITNLILEEEKGLLKTRKQSNEKISSSLNRITILMFILMTLFTILLVILSSVHLIRNKEKEERILELSLVYKKAAFRNKEKKEKSIELILANNELILKNTEKEKLAKELILANNELIKKELDQKQHIEELEKMMYMISHEVRQPIAHLLGLSNLFDQALGSSANLKKIVGFMKLAITSLDVFTKDLTKYVSGMMQSKKDKE